jgi:phage terminase large subunit-like protein
LRHFAELERQYCHFSTAGYMGARSPDHADAAIWALTELMIDREPQPNIRFPDISRHTWRPTSSY